MPLRIDFQLPAGGVERGVMSQACEYVGNDAVFGLRVIDPPRGEQRQVLVGREIPEETDLALFAADALALQFHVESVGAEDRGETLQGFAGRRRTLRAPGVADRSFFVAGERDQAI